MKLPDAVPAGFEVLGGAEVFVHGHLPLAAAFCRRLGLVALVNRLVPSQMAVSPGLMVQAMVLDTLSGRTPLYHLENFLSELDLELLLGEPVDAHAFNDTNLARSLDAIFEAGPSKIVTELGLQAAKIFSLDASVPSYDTTSTSVWGDYAACKSEDDPVPGPRIVHGHSKDHLPELKQFMTELLCVDRGVPIFGRTLDGNSSDKKSNNQMLTEISRLMARHGLGAGAFVYIADSAMVTEDNLQAIGQNRFITRLPANYKECDLAIARAVDAAAWVEIGALAEETQGKLRPCATYRAFETQVNLYGNDYRAVVIHSTSHDQRRQKKLDKAVAASEKKIAAELAKLPKHYFCEADAKAAAAIAEKLSGGLHSVSASVHEVKVRRPGRPPKNGPAPMDTRYELEFKTAVNTASLERERSLAGCFVLITNVPTTGDGAMDAKAIMRTYKGQYGVESDFAFLKDPLVVNDIFLKKPSRIDALGMVLIISLMVWRLMERSMRAHVENTKSTLPGWDRKATRKPTFYMMTWMIPKIMVAKTPTYRVLLSSLGSTETAYLLALGLDGSVFTNPKSFCTPIIPGKITAKG
jgi:transposase